MKVTIAHLIFASLTLAPVSAIVGGNKVVVGTKQYVAGIRFDSDSVLGDDFNFCAAALISSTHVLTTASCLPKYRANYVIVGSPYYSGEDKGVTYRVASRTKHPKFNPKTLSYNFAILELDGKTKYHPVSLPKADGNETQPGNSATAFGWGKTSTASHSDQLLSVSQNIISNDECRRARKSTTIDDSHMCSVGNPGQTPCKDDGGGPLILENDQGDFDDVLIGLISNSNFCGLNNSPTIYSRVSSVLTWIEDNLKLL